MNSWTEFHISIVYFTGLSIALIVGIMVVLFLRPISLTIKKIVGKLDIIWSSGFKITIILGGLLGAMSVSFKSCDGSYDYLLDSRYATAKQGINQVSASFEWLAIILGIWLVIFVVLHLKLNKNK